MFITDHAFAIKHNLTLHSLLKPLPVHNVDGTLNRPGAICHTTIQTLQIKNHATDFHQESTELYVTSLANQGIIFGTDWLRAHNAEVNWSHLQIVFSHLLFVAYCTCVCTMLQVSFPYLEIA